LLFFTLQPAVAQDVLKAEQPPSIMKYLIGQAPEYSVMVKALNTSGLDENFSGPGPITLFAPRNKAFDVLPAGTVDNWLKPEQKDSLKKILTYHAVAGNWPLKDLEQQIKASGGEFFLATLGEGGRVSFVLVGGKVAIKDKQGFKTVLETPAAAPNGMIYSIDKLLLH